MSQQSKWELVHRWSKAYVRSSREEKGAILDQFCRVTGHERKHAIKLLNGQVGRGGPRGGRPPKYGDAAIVVVKEIWQLTEQMCGKRLKEALPLWLPHYERHHGKLSREVREQVLSISAAQLDRVLAPYRPAAAQWRRVGPKPGSLIRKKVPVRAGAWETEEPGYLEVDSVAHCGGSMRGSFIWSVTYTDIATGWTLLAAVWNRGQGGILERTREVESRLPFRLRGFDCDNGGEFLNEYMLRYLVEQRGMPVEFTRSRPYRKNDNAHVEQKNYTHVRQLLGYQRLGRPELVESINALYQTSWEPFHNVFCPSVKLVHKEQINGRYKKIYDMPETPCRRLLASKGVSRENRRRLREMERDLDPIQLKSDIEKALAEILGSQK